MVADSDCRHEWDPARREWVKARALLEKEEEERKKKEEEEAMKVAEVAKLD